MKKSALCLLAALLVLSSPQYSAAADAPARDRTSDLASMRATHRLLVVAPHPDDESLCCAGVIKRARDAGAQVEIVWLTNGDAFEIDADLVEHKLRPTPSRLRELGILRAAEAQKAADILGVADGSRFLLGYPDRGLLPLMLDHYYFPFRSHYTDASAVWYEGALSPDAAYEGRNLRRDLQAVFDRLRPTHVLAPSPLDEHPDHRAAGDLVIRMLGERDELDLVRYWVVHGGAGWPAPRGLHVGVALEPPAHLRNMPWEEVRLTSAERDIKVRALKAHHTQMEIMPRFLLAFVRNNELFSRRPLPPDDLPPGKRGD